MRVALQLHAHLGWQRLFAGMLPLHLTLFSARAACARQDQGERGDVALPGNPGCPALELRATGQREWLILAYIAVVRCRLPLSFEMIDAERPKRQRLPPGIDVELQAVDSQRKPFVGDCLLDNDNLSHREASSRQAQTADIERDDAVFAFELQPAKSTVDTGAYGEQKHAHDRPEQEFPPLRHSPSRCVQRASISGSMRACDVP